MLVLGFSGFLDYEDEDDDENDYGPRSRHVLGWQHAGGPRRCGGMGVGLTRGPSGRADVAYHIHGDYRGITGGIQGTYRGLTGGLQGDG